MDRWATGLPRYEVRQDLAQCLPMGGKGTGVWAERALAASVDAFSVVGCSSLTDEGAVAVLCNIEDGQ